MIGAGQGGERVPVLIHVEVHGPVAGTGRVGDGTEPRRFKEIEPAEIAGRQRAPGDQDRQAGPRGAAKSVASEKCGRFGARKQGIKVNERDEIRAGEEGSKAADRLPDRIAGRDRPAEVVRVKPPARSSLESAASHPSSSRYSASASGVRVFGA